MVARQTVCTQKPDNRRARGHRRVTEQGEQMTLTTRSERVGRGPQRLRYSIVERAGGRGCNLLPVGFAQFTKQ